MRPEAQQFSYQRLYADESGESHFDQVEVALQLTDFAPPAAPAHLAVLGDVTSVAVVAGDEAWAGGEPHPAPARQYLAYLHGEVEVTASSGETRRFRAGDLLLLEDTTGKGHSTRALGVVNCLVIRAES
jgi:hypothetical protein